MTLKEKFEAFDFSDGATLFYSKDYDLNDLEQFDQYHEDLEDIYGIEDEPGFGVFIKNKTISSSMFDTNIAEIAFSVWKKNKLGV